MNIGTQPLRGALLALVVVAAGAGLITANAKAESGGDPYAEIEQMLGTVPSFVRAFPQAGVAGAWEELKAVQLSSDTALSPKVKELIGLAVAAQIPCHYCVYFHTATARANGASDQEIQEAVAMAAITRHWSTVLNGSQIDMQAFRKETDGILRYVAEQAAMHSAETSGR